MTFNDFYASRTTLERLENVFKDGYLQILNYISEAPEFFNNVISGDDLYDEFVMEPFEEIKEEQKLQKEIKKSKNREIKLIQIAKNQVLNRNKCHALIHIKRELRQCQSSLLHDDDFCHHHSKLDVLPYGRVNFEDDDNDDNNDDNNDNNDDNINEND